MPADLDELKRRAYGRPAEGIDAGEAQAELARLESWTTPALDLPEVEKPRGLWVATAAALVVASMVAFAPADSLSVFDRSQSAEDLIAPWVAFNGRVETVRLLASRPGWQVYGFQTSNDNVCLTSVIDERSAGGACTSAEAFRDVGLDVSTQTTSIFWGPTGDPRLYDAPYADVIREGKERPH